MKVYSVSEGKVIESLVEFKGTDKSPKITRSQTVISNLVARERGFFWPIPGLNTDPHQWSTELQLAECKFSRRRAPGKF